MDKRVNIFKMFVAIVIPLAVGFISSFITKDAMMSFNTMKKPPLAPPGVLFPTAWTILYILMGISSYIIYVNDAKNDLTSLSIKNKCLSLYAIQLVFNFFWSVIFFKFKLYVFAFAWLAILWILVFKLIIDSKKISKVASYLLIPYLVWMTFVGYLNIGIAVLNK